jgi:hypothetical protein
MDKGLNQWVCTLCDYVLIIPHHVANASIVPQPGQCLSCPGCDAPSNFFALVEPHTCPYFQQESYDDSNPTAFYIRQGSLVANLQMESMLSALANQVLILKEATAKIARSTIAISIPSINSHEYEKSDAEEADESAILNLRQ